MAVYRLWAGSFTEGTARDGVFALEFDGKELRVAQSWGGLTDPSYLQPMGDKVFAVEEMPADAAIIEITPGEEGFRRYPVPGNGLCHITACGNFLYAAGYSGGCLAGIDRQSGALCDYLEHQGKGPNALRQEKAHIHSAQPTPDGRGLLVADLGLDQLFHYRVAPDGKLSPHEPQPWVQVQPGQGPRHFAFHPNREWMYLVTELEPTLIVYKVHAGGDRLEYRAEHPLHSEIPCQEPTAADVHVTPDGRFVYASVRGTDRIYCFRILEGGAAIEQAGDFSSGGEVPRSFHLSPDGKYLATANQVTGNVVVFPIDAAAGCLGAPVAELRIPGASCVKWQG